MKSKTKFVCQACAFETQRWLGKCPGCDSWNTFVEERIEQSKRPSGAFAGSSGSLGGSKEKPMQLSEIATDEDPRYVTSIAELNRVLGGGIVPGSLILVGGDPGIGKSTLLLQLSDVLVRQKLRVLYVSGEESAKQLKLRSERLGVLPDGLFVLCETSVQRIEEAVEQVKPDFMVIDSIQTVYHPEVTSAPGSVSQVRECTGHFMRMAKVGGIATVIVGHVTKEGAIAGPRMLEHMVDCVLYFEGERHHSYRVLRAVKNRFGSTNEIGIFEMNESGLTEVGNPSALFLAERPLGVPGSTVVASLEGTRPILVEVQALVAPTHFVTPKRMATGVDSQRTAMMLAVLEKRVGLALQSHDAYVNAAGGVRLDEPAIDLALAVSLASSYRDQPTEPYDVIIGEVGLTGEVRAVSRVEQRIKEAAKLGFQRVIMPENGVQKQQWSIWEEKFGIKLIGVSSVSQALDVALLPSQGKRVLTPRPKVT